MLALSGCGLENLRKRQEEQAKKRKETVIILPVEAALLGRGDISTYFETTTRVEAERKVDVTSQGLGTCISVFAEEGDWVSQGQLLAEIDKKEAQASFRQSEMQVRQNKASYEVAKGQYEEGLSPKVDLDNAFFAYEQSIANLDMQRIKLENLSLRAPISGLVTARYIQAGMLVSSGSPAFQIVDPSSFVLIISPPEKELPRLHVGQLAKATIDALDEAEFDARVRRINPSVDPLTGTIKVVLDLDEESRKKLKESAFARVKLVMETHEDVAMAPKEAIVEENGRKYLFLVRRLETPPGGESEIEDTPPTAPARGTPMHLTSEVQASVKDDTDATQENSELAYIVERVEIETGFEDSENVEILSDLGESPFMVTNGQHTLKSGSRVKITNASKEIFLKAGLGPDEALAAALERREGEENELRLPKRLGDL